MAFSTYKPLSDYSLISVHDPAIDWAHSDRAGYEEEYAYDPSLLAFHDGQMPTRFVCRPLSARLLARLLDKLMRGQDSGGVEVAVHEAALLAFRWGLVDIENMPGFEAARHIQLGNPPSVRESWLDEGHLSIDVISEIGAVMLAKSRLTVADRKNS